MQANRKRPLTGLNTAKTNAPTFKNSLRQWQARFKAQQSSQNSGSQKDETRSTLA